MTATFSALTLVLTAAVVMTTACSPERPPARAGEAQERRTPPTLSELFPFTDGTVSEFSTENDLGETGILILEIARPRPEMVELSIAGRTQRLHLAKDRIDHATGGTLVELPLEAGRTFRGSFGTVTIESTEGSVTVPAGTFEQCLTLVEESTAPAKRSRSAYCPDVGLVELTVESFGSDGGSLTARLEHHGPRVQF